MEKEKKEEEENDKTVIQKIYEYWGSYMSYISQISL